MENLLLLHPNGKRAMEEELIRGRDMANQLLEVLIEDHDDNKSNINHHRGGDDKGSKKKVFPLPEDLVREVLKSFTNTLLLLNTNGGSGDVAAPVTVGDFSPSQREEGLDGTCKSLKTINTKNQRGSHKRKSIAPTWEKNTSILVEDGHAWRKYGQKKIMNAKYLRLCSSVIWENLNPRRRQQVTQISVGAVRFSGSFVSSFASPRSTAADIWATEQTRLRRRKPGNCDFFEWVYGERNHADEPSRSHSNCSANVSKPCNVALAKLETKLVNKFNNLDYGLLASWICLFVVSFFCFGNCLCR